MEQVKLPFRADIVGSFLRPERLKKARKDFESGFLSSTYKCNFLGADNKQ